MSILIDKSKKGDYSSFMITGFPSPAQGYESKGIDLNNVLIKHPSAAVFM